MSSRVIFAVLVVAACVGGCTTEGSTPATAPDSTAPATTQPAPSDPITSTTTIPPATTTTLDRLAEVTAIFDDLERRRLEAIDASDVAAFESVFANGPYLEESRVTLDLVVVVDSIGFETTQITLLTDSTDCIAAEISRDMSGAISGGGPGTSVHVVERRPDGAWGLSWIGGGWECDGPHPLGS